MFHLRLCLFVFANLFFFAKCSIPEEILCANSTCKEPISIAIGSVTYASSSRNVLSFKPGQEMTITSKSKNKKDYWGAIIDGRSGYVPSNLIKEVRIFHKFDDLIPVSVEDLTKNISKEKNSLPQTNNFSSENLAVSRENIVDKPKLPPTQTVPGGQGNSIKPDSSSEDYKVIEGTTVYVDEAQKITPSPAVDVTMNPQTNMPVVAGEGQERATISPQVINLNHDYEGQLLLKKNNLTIENEDDEDDDVEEEEEEEEEDDDGEEDEGDEEVSEEEIHGDAQEKKEVIDENMKSVPPTTQQEVSADEKVKSVPPTTQPQMSADENMKSVPPTIQQQMSADKNIKETGSQTVVNTIKSSFESQISSTIAGNDAQVEKDLQGGSLDNSSPVVSEQKEEATLNVVITEKISTDTTELDKVYADLNSPPQKQTELSEPVTGQPQAISTGSATVTPTMEIETPPQGHAESHEHVTDQPRRVFPESATSLSDTPSKSSAESYATVPDQHFQYTTPQPLQNPYSVAGEVLEDSSQPPEPSAARTEGKIQPTPEPPTTNLNDPFEAVTETVTEAVPPIVPETPTPVPDVIGPEPGEVWEHPETKPDEPGIFSQMARVFSSWLSFSREDVVDPENFQDAVVPEADVSPGSSGAVPTDFCRSSDGECQDYPAEDQQSSFWSWMPLSSVTFDGVPTSTNTFLYLVVTAVTVLLFTLGHNFIEKRGRTGPLIAKINKLEQELLVTSKECSLLKDEVQSARDKITLYENSANDELVLSLQGELEESKKTKAELESSIEVLQQELDAATEAGLDLNKMLSEVLTQKGGSESLLASVENLQAQLNSQQKVIDEMTKKLGVKNEENEVLQTALDSANERAESLEEELTEIRQNLNLHLKEKEDLTQDLNSQIVQLQFRMKQLNESKEKEMEKMTRAAEKLQTKLTETSKALAVKEEEFKALKESLKHLKTKGNVNLESVFDVSRCKAELVNAEKEKQALEMKLKEEGSSKKTLEDQAKYLNVEVQKLKKSFDEAEEKKNEAEKKLEVLSTYFKEKETQLQKELGLQEALWAQKKGDEKTVYNMMKSLQEEVESYKSQNETLKKEILDQERGLKNQIATLEQKAHENWVAARQAERKLEENKQEMAQLRNRLTLIEKNSTNAEGKASHRTSEELNGEPPTSPVLHDTSSPLLFPPPLPLDPNSSSLLPPGFMPHPMFMPPPMGGFMPPPPFLPGDRRPPPLGRMSSPPLNSRFSPSSPADYPFERMSSPPLSPPARNYRSPNEAEHVRHRTPPYPPLHPRNWDDANEIPGFIPISSQRDSIREHKGSNVSSGHSSSDSLDKSSRHSGRV